MTVVLSILLILITLITDCDGFRSPAVRTNVCRRCAWNRYALTFLQNAPPGRDEVLERENEKLKETNIPANSDKETTLTLRGEVFVTSAELPKASIDDIGDFFQTKTNRDLLVTGGGERSCNELKATPQQLNDWKNKCSLLGATQPDENDPILSIVSRGIEFPGLKVESNALIGAKYIEEDKNQRINSGKRGIPRYEFVLVTTEQIVSGLAPAVWIFKKLTGAENNSTEENLTSNSLSTVTYEEMENGKIVFRTDAYLSIGVTFPKLLLKILPGDKKTIEKRGGKSIVKTLDKDILDSMKSLEKAYSERFDFTL